MSDSSSRRDFLQRSSTVAAAAALGLGPLSREAAAATLESFSPPKDDPAAIRAFEARLQRAHPIPLDRVRVLGGPLKRAQDADAKYLLSLEPDRMMAFYRVRAGLPQKAEPYAGWDGGGRNLTGHVAGHYLSAVSLMYRATGDPHFKQRADYLVSELKVVQDKNGDGYLSALEGGREAFAAVSRGEIRSGGFDLNGLWSPWYTLHKTFAGLRDAYRHTGNRTALAVETKYAAWAEGVLKPLSHVQIAKMLNTEHGGMNEVLADLYADTGDRRWLDLSYRFEHHEFTDALKRHEDNLEGKHGNCQIPKLIGSAARYGYVGDAGDAQAAAFFWDRVVQHHSYATGGHGLAEYFGAPDKLAPRVDGRTCESCNEYNMLKLTRRLFSFRPDAFYADYHERALFNHVMASFDPDEGRMSYMVPVGRGEQQEYQDMQRSFTCCVGTGMENHGLHADGIYFESADTLWVNLFVPSSVQFTNGMRFEMATDFPDGNSATIKVTTSTPQLLTVAVRRPSWAGDGFVIKVNGSPIPQPPLASLRAGAAGGRPQQQDDRVLQPSTFVEVQRTWKTGDTIELTLPKSLHLEPTPDDRTVAAILWGPLVLAADLGPRVDERRRGAENLTPVPVLVAGNRPVAGWIIPSERTGDFVAKQVARVPSAPAAPGDVSLAPFYRTHRRRYSTYFDILTDTQFTDRAAAIAAEREHQRRVEAATVGFVQPGEMQPERDYNYQSDPVERRVDRAGGRVARAGTGWFSFDMPVDAAAPMALVVTYFNEQGLPPASGNFEILVDGTSIARFAPNTAKTGFYDVQYAVPANLASGKAKVTVKFQASQGGRIAPVFGVRMIRTSEI